MTRSRVFVLASIITVIVAIIGATSYVSIGYSHPSNISW